MIGIFLVRVARLEKERVFDTFGKEMYAMSEGFGSVFLCVVVGSMPCTMYTNSMVLSSDDDEKIVSWARGSDHWNIFHHTSIVRKRLLEYSTT